MIEVLHVSDHLGDQQAKTWVEHLLDVASAFPNSHHAIFILRRPSADRPTPPAVYISSTRNRYSLKPLFELRQHLQRQPVAILQPHTTKSVLFSILIKFFFNRQQRLIVHEHGAIYGQRWYRWCLRLFDGIIDHYLAVSAATRDKLKQTTGIKHEKISVIHNFVNTDLFDYRRYDRSEERQRLGVSHKLVLGFVGRLNRVKRLDRLLRQFNVIKMSLPKTHLVVAGGGPAETSLRQLAVTKNIQSNITFMGVRHDIPRLMSTFDVGILISAYENLSKVLLEMIAMRVYVVATNVGGNNEIIDRRVGRLIAKPTAAAIIDAIRELQEQPKDGRAFAEITERFSVPRHINKTENVYQQILKLP